MGAGAAPARAGVVAVCREWWLVRVWAGGTCRGRTSCSKKAKAESCSTHQTRRHGAGEVRVPAEVDAAEEDADGAGACGEAADGGGAPAVRGASWGDVEGRSAVDGARRSPRTATKPSSHGEPRRIHASTSSGSTSAVPSPLACGAGVGAWVVSEEVVGEVWWMGVAKMRRAGVFPVVAESAQPIEESGRLTAALERPEMQYNAHGHVEVRE
jgi:hypothetical protein